MNIHSDPNIWFDDAATSAMGKAFDQACKSLQDFGSAPEIIANLIIAAAKDGERDAARLYEQALKAFVIDDMSMLAVSVGSDLPVPVPAHAPVAHAACIPEQGEIKGHEVEHEFPGVGQRTMRLNARQVFYEGGSHATILLSMEDVTDRRVLEREKDALLQEKDQLLQEKDVLFEELQHRISNSLQVIASIILLKARTVQSEETRVHLQDTHKRVMSVAAVQEQLHVLGTIGSIEIAPYLSKLCEALAASMIGDSRPITLKVIGAVGSATSRQAESIGLIVTELVMNALKHAFPDEKVVGEISVMYDRAGTNWKLTVSDNGIGRPDGIFAQQKVGLGTGIIMALSHQLNAQVETLASGRGTSVSITHATFPTKAAA